MGMPLALPPSSPDLSLSSLRPPSPSPSPSPSSSPAQSPSQLALGPPKRGRVPFDLAAAVCPRAPALARGLDRSAVHAVAAHYGTETDRSARGRLDLVRVPLQDDSSVNTAVCIVYTDASACGDVPDCWELGCWNSRVLREGLGLFQVVLDVLAESTSIAGCVIESLTICDGLEQLDCVEEGIALLKNMPVEGIDSGSMDEHFVHPMTGDVIQIRIE